MFDLAVGRVPHEDFIINDKPFGVLDDVGRSLNTRINGELVPLLRISEPTKKLTKTLVPQRAS